MDNKTSEKIMQYCILVKLKFIQLLLIIEPITMCVGASGRINQRDMIHLGDSQGMLS